MLSSHANPLSSVREDNAGPSFSESDYYARQTRLAEVGEAGQEKLRAARVLAIGAGGLGSPSLSYLAAAGIGTIGICEGDKLEASNLHRQTLYHYATVGESKAQLAAARLREQNPFIDVQVHETPLTPENALELIGEYDLVLDCTDNFATKFMINDASVLTGTPAIFASIYQYEGQLVVVDTKAGGPCMRCLWPEVPEAGCVGSCAEVGVLGAVPGIFGTMQAMEAIKYFLGLPRIAPGELVIFDCLKYSIQHVPMPKARQCPVCGEAPRIRGIVRAEYLPPADISVDVLELDDARLTKYRLIDIREVAEVQKQPLERVAHEHIPMSAFDAEHPPIKSDEAVLLSCARGARSTTLANKLRERGYSNVFSVKDGWEAFHKRAER